MRKEILKKVKRVVIKIGSGVITSVGNGLDMERIKDLAAELVGFREHGIEVILVSSGAVAAGRRELGLADRPRTIPQKQAAAAIGQSKLMRAYEENFAGHGIKVAQLLLTRDDLASRPRFLNARATIDTLLECGIIPIINENDTVAVDEIKFGDNDNLSALVTNLVEAQLLVILTDIDGFHTADPRTDPAAKLIHLIRSITKETERAAGGSGTSVGTGGMATKIAAAKKVGRSGVPALMINGRQPGNLERVLTGEEVGTLFLPAEVSLNRRKHWIAYTQRTVGRVFVDSGAFKVLSQQGRSLLPSGVIRVEGKFDRGACVRICTPDGTEFARGITDYSSREMELIAGHKSAEIEGILGYRYGDDVIHRDNLVVL
ncbi:glutamate 5-kinase [Geotalea sp. SG265]|uniref:glutamate 5-kinase n=1 Tax=Geotalea sp. SG265 TaxID=2922867 RepID=UPI001FAE849B